MLLLYETGHMPNITLGRYTYTYTCVILLKSRMVLSAKTARTLRTVRSVDASTGSGDDVFTL